MRVLSLYQQHAKHTQQQQDSETDGQHPPDFWPTDQYKIKTGESQPNQNTDHKGNAFEFKSVIAQVVAVLLLQRARETQQAKAQSQLVCIGAGANIIKPRGGEGHRNL